jgi:O-antigen/teichoic acid export membrane protein
MSSAFGADPAPTEQNMPDDGQREGGRPVIERPASPGNGQSGTLHGNHLRVETAVGRHVRMDSVPYDLASAPRGRHARVDDTRYDSRPSPPGRHVRGEDTSTDFPAAEWGRHAYAGDLPPGSLPAALQRPSLAARWRHNHLVRNSLYLMLNSGLQAAAGFVFWVIAARLFSVSEVGLATALFSAVGIIAFAALLGLNSTVVRHLPRSSERNVLITAAMTLVSGCGVFLALCYLALIPVVSPKLDFVIHNPGMAVGVVLLGGVFGPLNLLTDSIFIGLRQARYNAIVDGGVGGVVKIVAALLVAGAGAYGLFVASAIGYAAAAVASLALLIAVNKFRPSLRGARAVLRPLMRFSAANYVGTLLTLLPTFLIPLIVLDRIGVHASAYYYVAFQMVSLLFAGVFAVEQAFLSEGSHEEGELRAVMRRSWRLLALFCLPATVILAVGARWLLLLFGHDYSVNGTDVLIVLATAALPFGLFNWLLTVLRLIGRLGFIIAGNVIYALLTCGLAWLLAPRGLVVLSLAWPIGLTVAAATMTVPVWRWARHPAPG